MDNPPFQFGLKTAFKATTCAAMLMAGFHYMPVHALLRVAAILGFWIVLIVFWVRLCLWAVDWRRPRDV